MDKVKKIFNFEIKQVGEESDRTLRFVGSDETPDRDNDIIEVTGWKLDEYLKNPVFLWAHNYDQPPVGKAINVSIDAVAKKLLFDVKFATAEEYPFADTIYRLYKGGYLRATSVGFRGIKHKTRDEDEVLQMPEWRRGRRYMEQSLLELSAVPVPSNPNALMMAKSAGIEIDEIEKALDLKEVELLVDTNTKEVFVTENGEKTAKVKIAPEYYEQIAMLPDEFQEKTGATLSVKTKKMLDEVHSSINGGNERLRKFIDASGTMPGDGEDEGDDPKTEDPKTIELAEIKLAEIKQALEEIKSQVLLLSQKEAPKEINLDAIEYIPPAHKDAAHDELLIKPEELKNMICGIIEDQLKGGSQHES